MGKTNVASAPTASKRRKVEKSLSGKSGSSRQGEVKALLDRAAQYGFPKLGEVKHKQTAWTMYCRVVEERGCVSRSVSYLFVLVFHCRPLHLLLHLLLD